VKQHLSDEAIAAFADGVLSGHARERARRHTHECPECAHLVAAQREAVWALRAAPAPALPCGLLDRLRDVPATTALHLPPTVVAPDGSPMLATLGAMHAAALVPEQAAGHAHRWRPILGTAAALAVAGAVAVGSAAAASSTAHHPPTHREPAPVNVQPAGYVPAQHR
jgi:anti-sigma factor RsiW